MVRSLDGQVTATKRSFTDKFWLSPGQIARNSCPSAHPPPRRQNRNMSIEIQLIFRLSEQSQAVKCEVCRHHRLQLLPGHFHKLLVGKRVGSFGHANDGDLGADIGLGLLPRLSGDERGFVNLSDKIQLSSHYFYLPFIKLIYINFPRKIE